MPHQKSVEGLRASARKRHLETVARAEDAIVRLCTQGKLITFPNVAQAAGVSISWLYKNSEIKQRIQALREQQRTEGLVQPAAVSQRAKGTSKDAIITTLRQQIKELRAENRELRKQLEVAYGQLRVNGR